MNLPPTLPDGTPAERIGRVLATIDGECWVAIDHASAEARPIDAFVFLERGDHAALTIERLPATPAALLQHTLVSGADPSRLTQRFELFGDLAATALLLRARAPARLPAAAVADALDALLGEAVSVEW